MSVVMLGLIKKTKYISCSPCLSKPFNLSIFTILTAIAYYYLASIIQGDAADLKNLKHGFIKVMPEHLSSLDKSDPKLKVKDTLSCAVPPIVHFVWCRRDNFQFQNYLSVLSAYKLLKPTEIIFHYVSEPEMDTKGYYQFHGDLLRDLPNFFMEPLQDSRACSDDNDVAIQVVAEILNEYGGIFIGMDIILSHNSLDYLDMPGASFSSASKEFSSSGLLFLSPETLDSSTGTSLATLLSSSVISCHSLDEFQPTHPCAISESEIFPFQILTVGSPFGKLARSLAYGKSEIIQPSVKNELIPNIVHYVWLGNRTFQFDNYLGLLSSLFIQKAETVLVHGDIEPHGLYWESAFKTGRVKFIRRDFPKIVFGNVIENPSHASDFLRYDILNRFGGIYVDWDVYWTKELSLFQRSHEALSGVDWPLNGKFPDVLNMGIVASVKGSRFARLMVESYRFYLKIDWGFNGIQMPYKVYEQQPEVLYIDYRLQVICFRLICHPAWVKGYKRPIDTHEGDVFDWKTDTNVIHTTDPDPPDYENRETLLAGKGMFAEIGQNVLRQAGDLK